MKPRQFFYFLVSGTLMGFVIISLELRVILEPLSKWEGSSTVELFLSGIQWYLGTHLFISLIVAGVILASSRVFKRAYNKVSGTWFWPLWGLFLLVLVDLFLIFGSTFGERFFRLSFSNQLWIFAILIGIIFLLTLFPCFLISFFYRSRHKIGVGLQLILISWISFVSVTWLHQEGIAITEQTPIMAQIFTFNILIWSLEALLLGGLALVLIAVFDWFIKHLRFLSPIGSSFESNRAPLTFLIVLTILIWIWISISVKSMEGSQTAIASGETAPVKAPNVIEIVIDTLGGKYLDSNTLKLYPGFTRLAQDGFHFDRAYATASTTAWSVPAILTSNFSFANSGKQFKNFGWLDEKEVTTAEILKSAGYETVGFSANPIISKTFNYAQGFDYFGQENNTRLLGFNLLKAFGAIKPRFAYQYGLVGAGIYYPDIKDIYSAVESFLSGNHSRPFYLYIQTMDMHGPYMPPKRYLDRGFTFDYFISYPEMLKQKYNGVIEQVPDNVKKNVLQLYLGGLKYTDEYIGRLIELLKKLDLYDNTLIIVTADHGEEFWEHGSVIHGHTLYNELIRVPLFIKPPVSLDQKRPFTRGLTIREGVSTLCILPTYHT